MLPSGEANAAYEWMMGQYGSAAGREDNSLEQELSRALAEHFGERVAFLVSSESENDYPGESKDATWQRRKEESLKVLKNAGCYLLVLDRTDFLPVNVHTKSLDIDISQIG